VAVAPAPAGGGDERARLAAMPPDSDAHGTASVALYVRAHGVYGKRRCSN